MHTWIIEVGIDVDGVRECILDINAGPDKDSATEIMEGLEGLTVGDVMDLDLDLDLWPLPAGGSFSDLIAGASLVLYDGEETITDTYEHVDFT